MRPDDVRMAGAIDLSALKRKATAPASPTAGASAADGAPASAWIIDVTEATFESDIVVRSSQVPVVIDFWAEWCEPCKQLTPVLEALVVEYGGQWILARIDVDAEQRVAQAFQIQSIPSVMAVIAGQPVPLFQGAMPAEQVRQVLDELLKVAAANGVSGVAAAPDGSLPAEVEPEPLVDPQLIAAYDAVEAGDVDSAMAEFRALLERKPGDVEARIGLGRCELIARVQGVDVAAMQARASADPTDLEAVMVIADIELLSDQVDEAIARLVASVRATSGAERDQARAHLIGLFAVLDPEDPRLVTGRRTLANALF